jgi:hypothetical protein
MNSGSAAAGVEGQVIEPSPKLLKKPHGHSRTTEAARPSSHPAEEKGRTARLQKTGHGAMRQAASDGNRDTGAQ